MSEKKMKDKRKKAKEMRHDDVKADKKLMNKMVKKDCMK